jgi:hypothetical protein
MKCKELSGANYFEYDRLVAAANIKNNGYPRPSLLALENFYFNDEEKMHKVFGVYDDNNVLNACIFIHFSANARYWKLAYVVKQPFAPFNCLAFAFDEAFKYAESIKYYHGYVKLFAGVDARWENWLSRRSEMFRRYTVATEEVIPPNKKSSFGMYWNEIQLGITYARPVLVKIYSLPDNLRIFSYE